MYRIIHLFTVVTVLFLAGCNSTHETKKNNDDVLKSSKEIKPVKSDAIKPDLIKKDATTIQIQSEVSTKQSVAPVTNETKIEKNL